MLLRATILAASLCVGSVVCRYTVRDIGFVDLRGPDYVLRLQAPAVLLEAHGEALAEFDPEALSNLKFERRVGDGEPRWTLVADQRAELELGAVDASAEDLGAQSRLDVILSDHTLGKLSAGALDHFASVVAIEGSAPAPNRSLHALIDEASTRFEEVADQLPRPIPWPLRTLVVDSEDRAKDRVLLWSLGLEDLRSDETAFALVYGRGKLAGPVLRGEDLDLREILEQLVLIGESCECDTSRAWTEEPRLPLRWNDDQRARAVASLGFDPDSPMVMGEVARLLTRSPKLVGERPEDRIESLLFGYQETDLVEEALAPARGGEMAAHGLQDSRAPEVVGAGAGDWGFEDEVATPEPRPEPSVERMSDSDLWGYSLFAASSLLAFGAMLFLAVRLSRGRAS